MALPVIAPRILCIGIPVRDLTFRVDSVPERGSKANATHLAEICGGNALNAAIAMARLGGRVAFAGPMGDARETSSSFILERMAAEGIETARVVRVPGAATPVSAIIIDATGERTLTIYRDPAKNSDWGHPNTFRDGTPVLVARYRHQPITSTLTNAVSLLSRDTITFARPFATSKGGVQLGRVGDTFEEHYTGQGNMPGPPSGYFVGYAVSR